MNPRMKIIAATLLAAVFTQSQYAQISSYIRLHGSEADAEVASIRASRATRPLLSFADFGTFLKPERLLALLTGATYVLMDAAAQTWTPDQYALVIAKATGTNADYAIKLAEDIVTPDSGMRGYHWKVLKAIPNIEWFPGDDIVKGASQLAIGAISKLHAFVSTRSSSLDALYEWMRLGEKIDEMSVRSVMILREGSFQVSDEAPDSAKDMKNFASAIAGALTGTANDAALVPQPGGNPFVEGVSGFANPFDTAEFRTGVDLLGSNAISVAEQGGFLDSLKSFAAAALPALGGLLGPAGAAAGNALGGFISGPKPAATLPPQAMAQVNRDLQQVYASKKDITKDDVVRALQSAVASLQR